MGLFTNLASKPAPSADPVALETLSAAAVEQEIREDADMTSDTDITATDLVPQQTTDDNPVQEVIMTTSPKTHTVTQTLSQFDLVQHRLRQAQQLLGQYQMIVAFKSVADTHALSAPMVATMRATPGFLEAADRFPEPTLFNAHPEHKSSARHAVGMESLNEAEISTITQIDQSMDQTANAFTQSLMSLPLTATSLKAQIAHARQVLDQTELTDEVLASVPTLTLTEMAYTDGLNKLTECLSQMSVFDVSDLIANPEQKMEELQGLDAAVESLGGLLGLGLNQQGLVDIERTDDYQLKASSFGTESMTKVALEHFLVSADALLDQVEGIAQRETEFSEGLQVAITQMPEQLEGSDTVYGKLDHLCLMGSYINFNSKALSTSLQLVSQLLGTVDSALDVA